MAGWIKWTCGLPDKPEVIRLAALLSLPREAVVCRLMRFWEWCDANVADSDVREAGSAFVKLSPNRGDNAAVVDALVGTPGFADSLAVVGWIKFRDDLVELPNFGRHNGETAKTRARNAKNQKNKRTGRPPQVDDSNPQTDGGGHRPTQQMSPPAGDIPVTRGEERRGNKDSVPSERATGADPPKSQRRPPSGPHAEVIAGFKARWEAVYPDNRMPFDGGKDGASVKWMLEQVGGDAPKLLGVFDRYFADRSDFVRGHPLGLLRSTFPKYLVTGAPNARDNRPGGVGRLGRAEPTPGKYAHLDAPRGPQAAGAAAADPEGAAGRPP